VTPALSALRRAGIRHAVLEYVHDPSVTSYGLEAAEALGVPAATVFKTLVAATEEGRLVVACVPVDRQLDLKALAAAVGGKRCEMAGLAAVERATGYVAGGISPVGQKRRLPVVVDESVLALEVVHVSAGRRGLQIRLSPADLVRAASATTAPIAH
jgi:Cys-tRNA(Pro)/Cys-tRNA(Cys) deacylase